MTVPFGLPDPPVMNRLARRGSPVVCPHCLDEGIVCESHPSFPWEVKVEGHDGTAPGHGAGMSCPYCCSPIPEGETVSITLAFTPDWKRT